VLIENFQVIRAVRVTDLFGCSGRIIRVIRVSPNNPNSPYEYINSNTSKIPNNP
jgi:hypothetical protein